MGNVATGCVVLVVALTPVLAAVTSPIWAPLWLLGWMVKRRLPTPEQKRVSELLASLDRTQAVKQRFWDERYGRKEP